MCSELTIYDGTNSEAIIKLTDTRGGGHEYQVGRLQDGNCWMLENLKLGSTTGPITLTPADSDVESNFVLPQLNDGSRTWDVSATNPNNDNNTPHIYGPVEGSSDSDPTKNYGYLYNFNAATAGETTTSLPMGNGQADNSICPYRWDLPSGGASGEFAMLNAKMHDPAATEPSEGYSPAHHQGWTYSGPFKGVLNGEWSVSSFYGQEIYGVMWTRSAYQYTSEYAHFADFGDETNPYVSPGNGYSTRGTGLAVRCHIHQAS